MRRHMEDNAIVADDRAPGPCWVVLRYPPTCTQWCSMRMLLWKANSPVQGPESGHAVCVCA